jgi:hypothetical protein
MGGAPAQPTIVAGARAGKRDLGGECDAERNLRPQKIYHEPIF